MWVGIFNDMDDEDGSTGMCERFVMMSDYIVKEVASMTSHYSIPMHHVEN